MKKKYRLDYIIIEPESRFEIIVLYWIIKSTGKVGTTIKWQEKIESGLKTKRSTEIVTVIIQYDDIRIDQTLKSIRITGRILDTNKDELVGKRVGIDISINDTAIVPRNDTVEKILSKTKAKKTILTIILDIDGYVIAEVSDKIEIIHEKYLPTTELLGDNVEEFNMDLRNINEIIKRYKEKGSTVILGYNIGSKNLAKKIKEIDIKLERALTANINGVLTVLKEIADQKDIIETNEMTKAIKTYEKLLSQDLTKVVYGIDEIIEKYRYGVIHTVIFTDKIIHSEEILNYLFEMFLSCIDVQFVDSYSSLGRYVNRFGGIVGISY